MFYLKHNASNSGDPTYSCIYVTPVSSVDKLTPCTGALAMSSASFSKSFGDAIEITADIVDPGVAEGINFSAYKLKLYGNINNNTIGPCAIYIEFVGAVLPYRDTGYVLPANIYDAWFGSSNQEVDISAESLGNLLKLDFSTLSGEAQQSLLNAARKLVNKVAIAGNTLTVYKEDGVTPAFTQTVGTNSSQQPIVSLNTV